MIRETAYLSLPYIRMVSMGAAVRIKANAKLTTDSGLDEGRGGN
jgi:hypothetical protein